MMAVVMMMVVMLAMSGIAVAPLRGFNPLGGLGRGGFPPSFGLSPLHGDDDDGANDDGGGGGGDGGGDGDGGDDSDDDAGDVWYSSCSQIRVLASTIQTIQNSTTMISNDADDDADPWLSF